MFLLNNASAATALQSLQQTQNALAATQAQLSTGLAINSAADNASYWSIAQTMNSDAGALGAVNSSLTQSSSMLSTTTSALTNAISVVNNIKNEVLSAAQPGASTASIAATLAQLGTQLKDIVSSSTVNGVNMLDNSTTTKGLDFVAGYTNNSGASASAVTNIHLATQSLVDTATSTGLLQASKATGSAAATDLTSLTATDLATATVGDTLSNVDKALAALTSYASTIGGTQTTISEQQSFVSSMQTNLTNGAASLVDANMNQVSTRLAALQTQQQLGVQALSIANQSSNMILKLFQ
jgi:flagellin